MDYRWCVVSVLFVVLIVIKGKVRALTLNIEGEEMSNFGHVINGRNGASNWKSIHLEQNDVLYFEICLMTSNTTVHIEKVVYSNDGGSDRIQVAIDNEIVGAFDTMAISDAGREWNKFRSSDTFSLLKSVEEGMHRLSIRVLKADSNGVEIDFIRLSIGNSQSKESLKCKVLCFDDITYADDMPFQMTTSVQGSAIQKSIRTSCAEEDNINIPVFHPSASKFVVSASLPRYTSFSNNRGADWSHCRMMSSYWSFININITLNDQVIKDNKTAQMSINMNPGDNSTDTSVTILVDFDLEGPVTGSTDSEIGMNVHLKGINTHGNLSLKFQYYGRNHVWSDLQVLTVADDQQVVMFSTADFAFAEGSGNSIRIEMTGNETLVGDVSIAELFMIKRHIKNDEFVSIYNDGVTIVETVDMDMWWRVNETMTLTLSSNGQIHDNVDFFRIYQKIPWSEDGFSQVFVLYQDGNVRLLPVTPHGLDWIPFGSSILIGQADPLSSRPSAPIAHLDVNPVTLQIKIHYLDGGIISFQIKSGLMDTKLIISDSTYTRDLNLFPFFTFRSMWVTEGNGDVDHITADGTETRDIIGNWQSLRGISSHFIENAFLNTIRLVQIYASRF